MHLYITTRGIKQDVDRFIQDLQAQYFPIEHSGKKALVQLAMRPIQLWEVVFPEPCLNEVIRTLDPEIQKNNKMPSIFTAGLRKSLGLKKAPDKDLNIPPRPLFKGWTQVELIGMKKDNYIDGNEQL